MQVGSTSFVSLYTVHQLNSGSRLVSGAIRPAGSMTADNQTSKRTDVVPVDLFQKSSLVRYKDSKAFYIDVYV